jgi:hypothetical protein
MLLTIIGACLILFVLRFLLAAFVAFLESRHY